MDDQRDERTEDDNTEQAETFDPALDAVFTPGSQVIIVGPRDKKYMITVQEKGRFSTTNGFIDFMDIRRATSGQVMRTHMGTKYRLFKPSYVDFVMNIKRRAQIIYPKDAAVMLMWGDVAPGMRVLESGVGQGALSIALLRALGPGGHLTSYEIRDDFAGDAEKFVTKFFGKKQENHAIEVRSVYDGIDGVYDRVMLDLPEPWHVVPHLSHALDDGGFMVSYLPSVPQVMKLVTALKEAGYFTDIETFEFTKKPWKVDGLAVRPENWSYTFSAFIVIARKIPVDSPLEDDADDGGAAVESAAEAIIDMKQAAMDADTVTPEELESYGIETDVEPEGEPEE